MTTNIVIIMTTKKHYNNYFKFKKKISLGKIKWL